MDSGIKISVEIQGEVTVGKDSTLAEIQVYVHQRVGVLAAFAKRTAFEYYLLGRALAIAKPQIKEKDGFVRWCEGNLPFSYERANQAIRLFNAVSGGDFDYDAHPDLEGLNVTHALRAFGILPLPKRKSEEDSTGGDTGSTTEGGDTKSVKGSGSTFEGGEGNTNVKGGDTGTTEEDEQKAKLRSAIEQAANVVEMCRYYTEEVIAAIDATDRLALDEAARLTIEALTSLRSRLKGGSGARKDWAKDGF